MKKLRNYAMPYSAFDGAGDMGDLDSLLSELDNPQGQNEPVVNGTGNGDQNGDQITDPNAGLVNDQNVVQQNTDPQQGQQPPANNGQQAQQPNDPNNNGNANQGNNTNAQHNQSAKQQYAFMQMRQQNRALMTALEGVAKAQGIQYTNQSDLLEKLNQNQLQQQAKNSNVPVELLQEVATLRQQQQQFTIQQNQNNMVNQFKQLMSDYNLDGDKVRNFADELLSHGINPATQQVDIVGKYKEYHQDEVISMMVDRGVQQALARLNTADTHSSTPQMQGGAGAGASGKPANQEQALDNILSQLDGK